MEQESKVEQEITESVVFKCYLFFYIYKIILKHDCQQQAPGYMYNYLLPNQIALGKHEIVYFPIYARRNHKSGYKNNNWLFTAAKQIYIVSGHISGFYISYVHKLYNSQNRSAKVFN